MCFVGGEEAAGVRARRAQPHDLRRLLPLLRRLRPPHARDAHCQVPQLICTTMICLPFMLLRFLRDHLSSLHSWFELICWLSFLGAVFCCIYIVY